MLLSTDFARSLEPNISEWLHEGFATHPDSTTEVFLIKDESAGIYRFQDSYGPKQLPKSSEGGASTELDKQLGYHTTAAPQVFKGKMSASREQARWNQYDVIENDAKDLGEAAIYSTNLFSNGVFICAFSTSYVSYGDDLPLCSTVHTRPDGGSTQSNASSTGIVLTEPNLETGMLALKQQLSGTGRKLALAGGLTCMVPEALEKEAVIITGSTKRSGIADNDLNWYLGRVNVYVNPFIGADVSDLDGNAGVDTRWYLFLKGTHKLTYIWDKRPIYDSWEEPDPGAMYTQVYMSAIAVWKHWYGFWGSKGGKIKNLMYMLIYHFIAIIMKLYKRLIQNLPQLQYQLCC